MPDKYLASPHMLLRATDAVLHPIRQLAAFPDDLKPTNRSSPILDNPIFEQRYWVDIRSKELF